MDSDVNLFKEFAAKNGWFWKDSQDSSEDFVLTNNKDRKYGPFECQLKKSDFGEYPYVDSLKYLATDRKMISNDFIDDADKKLCSTSGSWYDPED
jgi:hypothetical protein